MEFQETAHYHANIQIPDVLVSVESNDCLMCSIFWSVCRLNIKHEAPLLCVNINHFLWLMFETMYLSPRWPEQ